MRISDWSSDVCSSDLSLRFKRATVDTTLNRKDGKPPIAVSFSMRDDNGEWKVWDIKAENISLVLNFRTQIDAEIKKSSIPAVIERLNNGQRSEEHTSELQSLMRISYAVFCLKKKNHIQHINKINTYYKHTL